MESSKVTARHIKQVANDLQAAQINLIRHHCTDLPASKHKKRKSFVRPRPPSHKNDASDRQPVHSFHNNTNEKSVMPSMFTRTRKYVKNVEILCMQKVCSVQQKVSMQVLPQVWTLYYFMLSKETSFFQA